MVAVLAGLAWLAAIAGSAHAESKFALVVGINHYEHLGPVLQLQKAVNDANAVAQALERDGFTVLRGTELTRAQIVDKLYELTAKLQSGDTALFYFAGHGVALGSGNYLLPSDVPDIDEGQELRLSNQSIAETDVIAMLQEKGARVSIVILDACRDNPFKKPGFRSAGLSRGFGRIPEANGVFSLYSAGYGQSALDSLSREDDNPNSVFTRILVPLLTKPGLNLDDLAYDVRERVAALAATAADHHLQTPASYNQIIGGRVYLAGLPGTPELAAPPPPTGASMAAPPPAAPPPVALASQETALTPDPAAALTDTTALALAEQTELNRVGCEVGVPSGHWTVETRMALLRFMQYGHPTLIVDRPDRAALDQLLKQVGPACPSARRNPPRVTQQGIAPAPPRPAPRRLAQQLAHPPVERRAIARTAEKPASRRAGNCFQFNGQSVCE